MFEVTLPIGPSWNHYLGRKGNQTFKTREAREYEEAVRVALWKAGTPPQPYERPVAVHARWYFQSLRGDMLNYDKVPLDVLQERVYANDRLIHEYHAYRLIDRVNPRVELFIHEFETADDLAGCVPVKSRSR